MRLLAGLSSLCLATVFALGGSQAQACFRQIALQAWRHALGGGFGAILRGERRPRRARGKGQDQHQAGPIPCVAVPNRSHIDRLRPPSTRSTWPVT